MNIAPQRIIIDERISARDYNADRSQLVPEPPSCGAELFLFLRRDEIQMIFSIPGTVFSARVIYPLSCLSGETDPLALPHFCNICLCGTCGAGSRGGWLRDLGRGGGAVDCCGGVRRGGGGGVEWRGGGC